MTQGVVAGIVGGLIVTLLLGLLTWAREKSQQNHEARMRLRDERIRAYSEVLKATSGVDRRATALGTVEMLQAVSVAQMVAGGNAEVLDAIAELRKAWNKLREEAERGLLAIDEEEIKKREKENGKRRQRFLEATWKQTGTGG